MTNLALANIEQIEASLWSAADQLRANANLPSSEYVMPVLGVIFLRHAANRHAVALAQIEADQAAGSMPRRKLVKADFLKRRALMLPREAQYAELLRLPKGTNIGAALVAAMNDIEAEFPPLDGQLPKDYDRFDNDVLEDLLRTFDSDALRNASGDVFGRIYEYFLMKFAMQGAQDNGEFFTPPSLVQTIVNVIEPDHGVIFDPACGSGGMFVQSSHFIEEHGGDTGRKVTFYGQEKTGTTIRLAKMNLAVHGLEGDIREANTFYDDEHPIWGKCDFVMANPPFNVDMVDAEKVKDDRRLPFGLPGVNKAKKVSNGNYLWISYFHSYLGSKGRAGFVMSSQASSAGHAEAEVRRKIVETGDVDVMIAIRSNFFYTRTVPCELWHLDKGKPAGRRDLVLMLDARNVYRKVTRKIYDFSPEQQANLAAVVWLYRGQKDRFEKLVWDYFVRLGGEVSGVRRALDAFDDALAQCGTPVIEYIETLQDKKVAAASEEATLTIMKEVVDATKAYVADAKTLMNGLAAYSKTNAQPLATVNAGQHKARKAFEPHAERLKALVKQVDLVYKLSAREAELVQKISASEAAADLPFDRRKLGRELKVFEEARKRLGEQLKEAVYVYRQIVWLQERFPKAEFASVPGLCRAVMRAEIAKADWSLTPGRYVGVALAEVDEDFDFGQAMSELHQELEDRDAEATELAKKIQKNFERMIA